LERTIEEVLRLHAARLNSRWWRWPFVGPEYHLFADALRWADEYPPWWGLSELENALRYLWHYRTGLILGEARKGIELWDLGKQLFPHWVGFHPSRCRRVIPYVTIYWADRRSVEAAFQALFDSPDPASPNTT